MNKKYHGGTIGTYYIYNIIIYIPWPCAAWDTAYLPIGHHTLTSLIRLTLFGCMSDRTDRLLFFGLRPQFRNNRISDCWGHLLMGFWILPTTCKRNVTGGPTFVTADFSVSTSEDGVRQQRCERQHHHHRTASHLSLSSSFYMSPMVASDRFWLFGTHLQFVFFIPVDMRLVLWPVTSATTLALPYVVHL